MSYLNSRSKATLIAALRFWQRQGLANAVPEHAIATDGNSIPALTAVEIDELCQEINIGESSITEAASDLCDRLLDSESHAGEEAVPDVAEEAAEFIRSIMARMANLESKVSDVMPIIVLETNGGAYYGARSSAPVRLIVLDQDVESSDRERLMEINDDTFYVLDYRLTMAASQGADGIDPAFVQDIARQVDEGEIHPESP